MCPCVSLTTTGFGERIQVWRTAVWSSGFVEIYFSCPNTRYRLLGEQGSFEKRGFDVQEAQLVAGMIPAQEGFGEDPESDW